MDVDYSDCRTPEEITARIGWHSRQCGWTQVISLHCSHPNTKQENTRHTAIYWRARQMADGIRNDKYANLEVRDRRVDPDHYIYKTDERVA